jgi:predicted permease
LESLLLAVLGGALGLGLAYAAVELLRTIAPPELPRVHEIAIDLPVMLFTLVISILSGALFSLAPVLKLGTPDFTSLKEGARGSSEGPGRHRTRNALVVAELALAVVLMISSGLLIRTVALMRQVHPGFTRPQEVQTFRLTIPETLVADDLQFARTVEQIAQRLEQVPGVASIGVSSSITMDGEDNTNPLYVEDVPAAGPMLTPFRRFKSVAPGYFETMGNRVVAGRTITWTDIHENRSVIVISEALAREYWQDPSRALGERVRGTFGETPWREIVGVVGDERDDGLNQPVTPIVYWPLLNDTYQERTIAFAVRSSRVGSPGFVRELQQAIWSVNANLPIASAQTLEEIKASSMARTSFAMAMLAISAAIAMLLGIVGIYAVIAYVAAQRTREIGIRLALGAQLGDVRKLFLRHGVRLTAIGIAFGLVAALALTRAMSALLFGVSPMDPVTYVAVSVVLGSVALLSTWLPARRASRVDPIIALRADA